jgi:tetratricopeptide (TPR) repeat protein
VFVALALTWIVALQDTDELQKAGNALLDREDFKAALLKFEKVITAAPGKADGYLGRGKALAGLKLVEDAENDLSRSLEIDPNLVEAHYWRGHVRVRRGSHSEALADFDVCEERGFRPPPIYEGRGFALNELGRYGEAEQQFARALERGRRSSSVYQGRAWSRMSQGNLRGAISDQTRAIELDPGDASAYIRRGVAYYGEQSWDNALRDFRRGLESGRQSAYLHHWIFLCRIRMGQRDAAIQEVKDALKTPAVLKSSAWERKVLAFHLGDVAEDAFLEAAGRQNDLSTAYLCTGTRKLLEGKIPEALEHFQKAVLKPGRQDPDAVVSSAEIVRQRRLELERIIQDLEKKFRALGRFEATFDLNDVPKADDETNVGRFILTVDLQKSQGHFKVIGKDLKQNRNFTMNLYLKDLQLEEWVTGRGSGNGYRRTDLSGMHRFLADLEREVAQIVPPDPAAAAVHEVGVRVKLNLEGKPSRSEEGSIVVGVGIGNSPASWLEQTLGPGDSFRDGTELVLEFPARRKTVVIDRKTGLLKFMSVVDYDGTKRSFTLTSFKQIDAWPDVGRPEKTKGAPFDLGEFKAQVTQQEELLHTQMCKMLQRWEELVKARKEDEVAGLLTRWAARYTDGIHTHVVRRIAGDKIQKALNLGTTPAELLRNAEAESRRFAERFADERKILDGAMKDHLSELVDRTESGLFGHLIDSRLHPVARAMVRKAMAPEKVEEVRKALYGDRLEQLFRDELASRTSALNPLRRVTPGSAGSPSPSRRR